MNIMPYIPAAWQLITNARTLITGIKNARTYRKTMRETLKAQAAPHLEAQAAWADIEAQIYTREINNAWYQSKGLSAPERPPIEFPESLTKYMNNNPTTPTAP